MRKAVIKRYNVEIMAEKIVVGGKTAGTPPYSTLQILNVPADRAGTFVPAMPRRKAPKTSRSHDHESARGSRSSCTSSEPKKADRPYPFFHSRPSNRHIRSSMRLVHPQAKLTPCLQQTYEGMHVAGANQPTHGTRPQKAETARQSVRAA